jgi:hypothetical protein
MDSSFANSDAKQLIRDRLQSLVFRQWPFPQLDLTTIRFLKVRCEPNYQVHYVAVQDIIGQRWNFSILLALAQRERLWYVKTLGGSFEETLNEPPELRDSPWIRLEMLFMSDEFYAFGEVFDKGYHIERVRLLEQGKLVLEDTVQDGIVLFYSDHVPTIPPIQLELYNTSGILVSRQTETLGSFPSVTKEV